MAVLEITLAVILTLLGFAILAILLTRWTRCKQNEIDVSRYSSEQSASLLDYEDSTGFRHSYSTESDTSYDDLEGSKGDYTPSANSLALSLSHIGEQRGDTKGFKVIPEPLSGTAGPITGAIGPIMQFTAPIPGATGPIKLSQKTIVQTPGPIVQYTGPSAETSEMTTTGYSSSGPPSTRRGLPLAPIMISQRTSTRPEKSKIRQEEPTHVAVPIITSMPVAIGPVAAVDSSGKITLAPMEKTSHPSIVTSKPIRTTSGQTITTREPVVSLSVTSFGRHSATREKHVPSTAKAAPPLNRAVPPTRTAEKISKPASTIRSTSVPTM
nr:testis-expressed basic protein 1-like [Equus asinus]